MLGTSLTVDLNKLPKAKVSAVKREAKRLGMSPNAYVLRVVEESLDLDKEARSSSWETLTAPFRKAFEGLADEEIDALVERARRAKASSKRRRR
jgi:hypothetical protein